MKLFVGNLPLTITKPDIYQLFRQCGEIESIQLHYDQNTGRFKGAAFVTYFSDKDATNAIHHYHRTIPFTNV